MHRLPLAPEGLAFVLAGIVLSVLLGLVAPWLSLVGLLPTLFVVFFFRNPRRTGPDMPDALLSPADGTILAVSELAHADFIDGPARQISIFMSLFNAHINRAPLSGDVAWRTYRPGRYLPAFKGHAGELNERNSLGIVQGTRRVVVSQITGFIARRIVCDVQTGDHLVQRQRFGMIRFGSRAELICPANVRLVVRVGDRVKAGRTVLATFLESSEVPDAV